MMHDSTNNVPSMYTGANNVVCVKNTNLTGFSPPVLNDSVAYFKDAASNITTSNITFNLANCTIEYFIYQAQEKPTTCNIGPISLSINQNQQFVFKNGTYPAIDSYSGIKTNWWNHVAVSTDGSKIRMYVNGTQLLNPAPSIVPFGIESVTRSYPMTLAGNNAYYSEIRVSNTCLYTDTAIAPTLPFSSDSSTSFLLKHTISSSYFSSRLESSDPFGTKGFWQGWYYMTSTSTVDVTTSSTVQKSSFVVGTIDGAPQHYVNPSKQTISLFSNLYFPIQIITAPGSTANINSVNVLNQYIENVDFPVNFKINRNGTVLMYNGTVPNFVNGYDLIFEIDKNQNKFAIKQTGSSNYLSKSSGGQLSLSPIDITSADYQWSASSPSPGRYILSTYGIPLTSDPIQFLDMTPDSGQNYMWVSLYTTSCSATFYTTATTYISTVPIDVYFSTTGVITSYNKLIPPAITALGTVGNLPTITNLANNVTYYAYVTVPSDPGYKYIPVSFKTKIFGFAAAASPVPYSTSITFTPTYRVYPSNQSIRVYLSDAGGSYTQLSTSTSPYYLSTDSGTLASPPTIYGLTPTLTYSFYIYALGDATYDSYGTSADDISVTTQYIGTAQITGFTDSQNGYITPAISYTIYPPTQYVNVYCSISGGNYNLLSTSTSPALSTNTGTLGTLPDVSLPSAVTTTYSFYIRTVRDAIYDSYGSPTDAISFVSKLFGTATINVFTPDATYANVSFTTKYTIFQPTVPVSVYLSDAGGSYTQLSTSTRPYYLSTNSGTLATPPIISNLLLNNTYSAYITVPADSTSYSYGSVANAVPVIRFGYATINTLTPNVFTGNVSLTTNYKLFQPTSPANVYLSDAGGSYTQLSTSTRPYYLSTNSGTLASPPIISNLLPGNTYSVYITAPADANTYAFGSSANAVSVQVVGTNPLEYPPTMLTVNGTNTISGQYYGNGIYNVTSSSASAAPLTNCYSVFAKYSNIADWRTATQSYTLSAYTGGFSTSVSGSSISGEWVQLQLPYAINLTSYNVLSSAVNSGNCAATAWTVAGSPDGSTWLSVDSQTGQPHPSTSTLYTYSSFAAQPAYSYYRFIIQRNGSSTTQDVASFSEIYLYGGTSIYTLYPFSGMSFTTSSTVNNAGFGPSYTEVINYSNTSTSNASWVSNNKYLDVGTLTNTFNGVFSNTAGGSGVRGTGTTGYHLWTVPTTGPYTFIVAGAGSGKVIRCNGMVMYDSTTLNAGDVIAMCVGRTGNFNWSYEAGSGGTFVYNVTRSTLLFVAGGAGGGFVTSNPTVVAASSTKAGQSSTTAGGTNGSAGTIGASGSAGGGYLSGPTVFGPDQGWTGAGFFFGAQGGGYSSGQIDSGAGGFGCGGSVGNNNGAGGGGGYSGGGGANNTNGGGGGSYSLNFPTNITSNLQYGNNGQGFVAVCLGTRYLDGSTAQYAAPNALSILAVYAARGQTATDGVYWINLPNVGPTQTYCIMNRNADGGGWMLSMKATTGTTFQYSSTHWTTASVLNKSDLTRNDGDAKYDVFNTYKGSSVMALWPDLTIYGNGSLGASNPYSCWSWVQDYDQFTYTRTPLELFQAGPNISAATYSAFSGWNSSIWSSEAGNNFYGFNFNSSPNGSVRWGFAFNDQLDWGTDDVNGGIGMNWPGVVYSAGNYNNGPGTPGMGTKSARVEVYVR